MTCPTAVPLCLGQAQAGRPGPGLVSGAEVEALAPFSIGGAVFVSGGSGKHVTCHARDHVASHRCARALQNKHLHEAGLSFPALGGERRAKIVDALFGGRRLARAVCLCRGSLFAGRFEGFSRRGCTERGNTKREEAGLNLEPVSSRGATVRISH